MGWQKVKISHFLKERPDRIKPDAANETELNRLEKINFSGKIFINENKPTRTGMILVKKGDLVISGINVEKGALAVYQGDEDLLATIHYSSYSYDKSKIDIEFLKWFLKSDAFKQALLSQTKGGIKTELKPKKFLPLEIDLPDLDTQIGIRNKLNSVNDEIGDVVDIQNDNANYITKLRQAILSEAIQGKLVPQDPNDEPASILLEKIKAEKEKLIKEKKIKKEKPLPLISEEEIPYELPKGWEWYRLGNLTEIITKGSSPKWQGVNYCDKENGILFITSENVTNYKINLTKEKFVDKKFNEIEPRSILKQGDFLMNIVGASIGRTAIYNLNVNNANINQAVCLIRILNLNYFETNYLLHFFNSQLCISYMYDKQVDMVRPNLSMGNIAKFLIPLPPLAEQKRIVQKVDQLMKLCDELESQVKENQKNSSSLMNAVLREAFKNEA